MQPYTCEEASERVSRLARKARELADMEIIIPKTEAMLVRKDVHVRKDKIEAEEFTDMGFKHVFDWCGMSYPTNDGLCTHTTVHCKVKKGTSRLKRYWTLEEVRRRGSIWYGGKENGRRTRKRGKTGGMVTIT